MDQKIYSMQLFLVSLLLLWDGIQAEGGEPGCWEYPDMDSCISNCLCMWCPLGSDPFQGSCSFSHIDNTMITIRGDEDDENESNSSSSSSSSSSGCITLATSSHCRHHEPKEIIDALIGVALMIVLPLFIMLIYILFSYQRRRQYVPV